MEKYGEFESEDEKIQKDLKDKELASIKKPGEVEYITREEYDRRCKEIARCKRDIVYFAEKYFKIINLDKGLMTIKLYDKQKELLNFFKDEKRCIVCASRQSSKCCDWKTRITIRNKRHKWLKLNVPVGVFYWTMRLFRIFR